MTAKHFLGLFLIPTLAASSAASTAAAQVSPAADPCAEARHIAQSQPCLAGAADCGAAQRWRQVFGPPGKGIAEPELATTLPPDLAARLTDEKIPIQASEPLRSVLTRLAAAAEVDLLVDPRVTGDFRAKPGTLPLREAWRTVLGTAGLAARSEGGRVLVTRAARDGGSPRTDSRVATGFNCPTH